MTQKTATLGIILAGGLARRMGGGDKCLLPLGGRTLLDRAIRKASPQVSELLLNANGNHLRFTRSGLTILSDEYPNFPGPLAGIHAGLEWMQHHRPELEWMASFASDTPFFPDTLVQTLLSHAKDSDAEIAVASSDGQLHPIFALWHRSLLPEVRKALEGDTVPRLQDWVKARRWVEVPFREAGYDPFLNINRPSDLYSAEAVIPLADTRS